MHGGQNPYRLDEEVGFFVQATFGGRDSRIQARLGSAILYMAAILTWVDLKGNCMKSLSTYKTQMTAGLFDVSSAWTGVPFIGVANCDTLCSPAMVDY